jgi:WD40 repeat protein
LYTPGVALPKKTLPVQTGWVTHVAFSPADGCLLVITEDRGTVTLWDVESGKETTKQPPFRERCGLSASASYSPDGQKLALAGSIGGSIGHGYAEIAIWDMTAKTRIASWTQKRVLIPSMAISPDGRILATGTGGHTDSESKRQIKLWRIPR